MRVDHIIFAAPVLEDGVREIERRFGIGAGGGGQHVGQGTHNALLALGPRTYLEVVAPDPGQPEPDGPRPYGVDGVVRAGLVGWALACDDIDTAVRDARTAGFDPGDVIEGHRLTSAGAMLRWRLTSNARTAGVTPFLISWGDTPHPAATAPSGMRLDSIRLEHPDPELINRRMRILGFPVEVARAEQPALVASISGPTAAGELR
jgi:hypothetical protein